MKVVHRQYDFSGGFNSYDPDDAVGPSQFTGGQNIRFYGRGIQNRKGQTKLNTNAVSGAGKVASLFRFYKDDGTTRKLIGLSGTTLYDWSTTPTAITRTSGTWSSGATLGAAAMLNSAFIMDGVSAPQKWTASGSTTDMAGSPPTTANILVSSPTANRLFALKGKRLYWSALGNPEDWTATNDAGFADIPFRKGDNGTALAVLPNGVLLIFSNNSMHTLSGADASNFNRREFDQNVGTRSPQTIKSGRGGLFFLGNDDRVYFCDGAKNTYISRDVQATLDTGSTGDYPNAAAWVEKNDQYCLAYSAAGGNNDSVLIHNWRVNPKGAWLPPDKQKAVASVAVDDGVVGQVYTGDYSGFVQQQDVGTTDNGTAVASYIDTKYDSYEEPERRKKTKRTYFKFLPSGAYSATVSVAKDGSTLSQVATVDLSTGAAALDSNSYSLDSLTTALDGGLSEKVVRVSAIRNCRSLKHRWAVSNPFRLYGYSTILLKKSIK